MAANGHAAAESRSVHRQSARSSRPEWRVRYGSEEFKTWQKEHPSEHISYEDWKDSQHVKGLSLYYAALHIWEETDSSEEEEIEQSKVEVRSRTAHGQSAREPKKTLKPNGNGLSRSVGSATPSATAQYEDVSPPSRKKRKSRKKYLSQEIVASDDNEDTEAATPKGETTTPLAALITVNGRRKSSNRKPRKKPLSEETISPEDEDDDPMAMNATITPAIASPLPVRSAPRHASMGQDPQPHKKTILKLSTRGKATKNKCLISSEMNQSGEKILDDDDDGMDMSEATPAATPADSVAATETQNTATIGGRENHETHNVTPMQGKTVPMDSTSESPAATRRGLRERRPAQQRPYSMDAQTYEDSDMDATEEEVIPEAPSILESRRVSIASLKEAPYGQLDEETLAILQGGVGRAPDETRETPRSTANRAKHFKGKGRAWKKEESDEDLEFDPGKKKASKAKVKTAVPASQPKKRGRPRKSNLSEDVVRDDSDDQGSVKAEEASPWSAAAESGTRKSRKLSRKSVLSAEIVRDDTDDEENSVAMDTASATADTPEVTPPAQKEPAPHVGGKSSDQSTSPKVSVVDYSKEPENSISSTPNDSPSKSLFTLTSEPQQALLLHNTEEEALSTSKAAEEDITKASNPDDIEAHMASVNAEDDDDDDGELYAR
ncbi:hypothetical protein ACEQ8H_000986 [Pleosporales sp. CAS-2024a]